MRLALVLCLPAMLSARVLTPVWIELGPDGATLARVVVERGSGCPELRVDGHRLVMHFRQPVPEGFEPACEATIPPDTHSLRWQKRRLKLPKTPARVIALGDTGCRINHGMLQPCNDPNLWPFASVAEQIAQRKPDLIVHVGDYLYRESVCPAMVEACAGPHGDNWETWKADFFAPAEAALAAAPWVFARGNHESCERSYRGWFYYLDPRPFAGSCEAYSDPYIAQVGDLRIAVLDSAETKDAPASTPEQIAIYAKELERLSNRADWLVDHHPFWAYVSRRNTISAEPQTLGAGWLKAQPRGIHLILSGHVHLFEFLELASQPVRQIIAGDGGTQLLTGIPAGASALTTGDMTKAGAVNLSFGFTELVRTRLGWRLSLRNVDGIAETECALPDRNASSCRVTSQK